MTNLAALYLSYILLNLLSIVDSHTHGHHYGWTFEFSNSVKITTKDGLQDDKHGRGLALCDNRAIVGSYVDTFRSVQSGSAYVYKLINGNWEVETKLFPSIGNDEDYFGWSISCYQNRTFIGAYGDDLYNTNNGAVYMFDYIDGKWKETAIFYSTNPAKNEQFGFSIDYHDDLLVVGAPGNKELYTQCGAVYTFRRLQEGESKDTTYDDDDAVAPPDGWYLDAMLVPEDATSYMNFGWSLSMKYGFLIVGAPWADSKTGAAYIYARNTTDANYYDDMYYQYQGDQYELLARITSPFPSPKTYFGCSVSMSDNLAVVGQYLMSSYTSGDSDASVISGGAFVFKRGEFNIIGEWSPNYYKETWGAVFDLGSLVNVGNYGFFGYSVAIHSNVVVVGAPADGVVNTNATVHIFQSGDDKRETWEHTASWNGRAVDSAEFALHDKLYSRLGVEVAVSKGRVLFGDTNGLNYEGVRSGCAYALEGEPMDMTSSDKPKEEPLSTESELTWVFLVIIPITICCAFCCVLANKRTERDVMNDLVTAEMDEMSTRSSVDASMSMSTRIAKWIKPLSSHGAVDWMRNEMQPVRPLDVIVTMK
jgi:hypothetical protein